MPRQRCHPAGIAAPCPKHSGNVNQGFHLRNINQRHQFVFITMGKEIIKQTWLTRFYQLCHRKLWLFANGINMEQESDLVYEGKLVHESSYPQRTSKYEEVEIDGIKVDYYDARNKVIHEIKKSNKVEKAHEWQLKYYIMSSNNMELKE